MLENVELESSHNYGDVRQRKRMNTYLARGVLDEDVRVDELEVELEVLELLLELEELLETVEDVVVEEDCEEVLEGVVEVLEGVVEVLGGVLTGELLGDEDWEGDCVSDDVGEELGGAELAGEVITDAEDVC